MLNTKNIRPVWAEINLDNLENNIKEVKRLAKPGTLVTAVIKADGYGHGAVAIAKTLLENGADRLAVAALDEAIELRQAGITARILVLGFTGVERTQEVIANDVDQCVYHLEVAKAFDVEAKRKNKVAKLHIKIDSGMGRIGFLPNEASIADIIEISKMNNVCLEGIFTHFCVADEADKTFTESQYKKFKWVCDTLEEKGVKIKVRHCANSATIVDIEDMHFDMVRAGIVLYGLAPSNDVLLDRIHLKPVMTLKARISNVKTIQPGDSVSYGRKFIAEKPTKIASLPLGYADGYTRMLSDKAEVLIQEQRVKVVGRICMDQCMIDVTTIENVNVGDEVVLFGTQGKTSLPVDELAAHLGTINYEIVCMLARRVPRVYIKNDKVIKIVNYLYE